MGFYETRNKVEKQLRESIDDNKKLDNINFTHFLISQIEDHVSFFIVGKKCGRVFTVKEIIINFKEYNLI